MSILKKTAAPVAIAAILALGLTGQAQATNCKEMSQSKCEKSDACSYVKGYKTKSGTQVKGYCRNKPKSSGSSKKKDSKK